MAYYTGIAEGHGLIGVLLSDMAGLTCLPINTRVCQNWRHVIANRRCLIRKSANSYQFNAVNSTQRDGSRLLKRLVGRPFAKM